MGYKKLDVELIDVIHVYCISEIGIPSGQFFVRLRPTCRKNQTG